MFNYKSWSRFWRRLREEGGRVLEWRRVASEGSEEVTYLNGDLKDEKASGKAFPGPAHGNSIRRDPVVRASCCVLGPVRRSG